MLTFHLYQYRFGFSFVKGSPATPEATERLLERLAFIRPTHYGEMKPWTMCRYDLLKQSRRLLGFYV